MSAVLTAVPPATLPAAAEPLPDSGRRVVLDDVDWTTYEAIGAALSNRPGLRLTYDRRSLEIMTLSPEHERRKYILGRLIDTMSDELGIPMAGFASTTYKRQDQDQGLEPDQCYYHRNRDRVRGVRRLDLTRDPPPDLAVEIDATHSSIDKMSIYARLGVPEVWRLDGDSLTVSVLNAGGQYEQAARSPTFPSIAIGELVRFMRQGIDRDDFEMIQSFRAWIRQGQTAPLGG